MTDRDAENLLTLSKVSAGYGGRLIINNISIKLAPGGFCALLGLNGSGKTTLLKAICGLIPLGGGRILSGDTDLSDLGEKKRARYISYIPQRHSKLIGVTVFDAVMMGQNAEMGVLTSPPERYREQALRALEKMQILELASCDFSKLSEGQKQLVILARALAQNAPVMLMDEPDSALDFLNKHRILTEIRALVHSEKKAGLITLHDPNFALGYCDRIIMLRDGEIVSDINISEATMEDIRYSLGDIYGTLEVSQSLVPAGSVAPSTYA